METSVHIRIMNIQRRIATSFDQPNYNDLDIEDHHRCFGLGCYFMAEVLAAASYSRIGLIIYLAVRARRVRVPVGSKFHL